MRSERLYLADIGDAIKSIGRWMDGCDETRFCQDEILQCAVLPKLSVIGEAAARLSPETWSQAPQVPWQEIIGFRNVAVHAYFSVDWKVVFITATDDLSSLQEAVTILLNEPMR